MKKVIIISMLIVFLSTNAYALDTTLLDMRSKLFQESKKIKSELGKTKDIVLMNSMWDSCIMAMSQIDAYFYMLKIFNTIDKKDVSKEAIQSLADWLKEIKRAAQLNVKSLNSVTTTVDAKTKVYMKILVRQFKDLKKRADRELAKISILTHSLKLRK